MVVVNDDDMNGGRGYYYLLWLGCDAYKWLNIITGVGFVTGY